MSLSPEYLSALSLYQKHDLAGAEDAIKKALNASPHDAATLNLGAAIAQALGHSEDALRSFERLIALQPTNPTHHYNRAFVLESVGRSSDAAESYQAALKLQPKHRDSRLNLGNVFVLLGRFEDAVGLYLGLLKDNPADSGARLNLGLAYLNMGNPVAAKSEFKMVLDQNPADHAAHHALALALKDLGDTAQALTQVSRAVELGGQIAEYIHTDGLIMMQMGAAPAAIAKFQHAAALEPQNQRFRNSLGAAKMTLGDHKASIEDFRAVLKVDPKNADALFNYASALLDSGSVAASIESLERAVSLKSDFADGHFLLASALSQLGFGTASELHLSRARELAPNNPFFEFVESAAHFSKGCFADGWRCLDRRFDLTSTPKYQSKGIMRRPTPPQYWAGEDISQKSIILWTEQGIGDEILFSSLIPDIMKRCKNVALACSGRLVPIFQRSFPGLKVMDATLHSNQAMQFDYQIALGSLGQYLRPDLAAFPKHSGYLHADQHSSAVFRDRYGRLPRVGLSWRSFVPRFGLSKSLPLIAMEGLLSWPGIQFVSLQYGDVATDIQSLSDVNRNSLFVDPTVDSTKDMDAFFAQVSAMDLVITTSNTTAHVAGALGVPTWLILPEGIGPLWYWFSGHASSPWYPAMKIFRGYASLDPTKSWWTGPLADIAAALPAWASTKK